MPDLCWNSAGLPEWSHLCEHSRQLQVIFQNHTLKSYTKHCYVCSIYPICSTSLEKKSMYFLCTIIHFSLRNRKIPILYSQVHHGRVYITCFDTKRAARTRFITQPHWGLRLSPLIYHLPMRQRRVRKWTRWTMDKEKSSAPQGYDLLESS